MLSDVTFGQYYPGTSLLHRLDPRTKLLLTLIYLITIFIPQNWFGLAGAVGFLLFALLLSRLPIRLTLRTIKTVLPIIIFTSLLNVLYVDGTPLFVWGFIHVTQEGLATAIFISLRIICLIVGSSLLTYTTTPTMLTDALERLLAPIKWLHIPLPVHSMAMVMTIALRFIPTLIEETDMIMSAQKARGADLESGGLLKRIKALIPILIPLFASALRRANDLAIAMECRCYHGGDGRTRMKQMHMHLRDAAALLTIALLLAGMIVLNIYFPSVL